MHSEGGKANNSNGNNNTEDLKGGGVDEENDGDRLSVSILSSWEGGGVK